MKIIDEISDKMPLSEIGHGATEIKFAVINPATGHTITPFCKCKDYFTDMFWGNETKKEVNVCGFKWSPNQDKGILDKATFSIAVRKSARNNKSDIKKVTEKEADSIIAILNKFEKKLKFKPTKFEIDEDEKHIILKIPAGWRKIPYLVSTLFMLIRLGFTYDKSKDPVEFFSTAKGSDFMSPNDQSYFNQVKKRLSDLLDGKVDTKQTYNMYASGSAIHSMSGIVCYHGYNV